MPSDFSENASIPKITADWVTVPNAGKRAIQTGDSGAPLLAANVGTATARIATTPAETNDRIEPVRHVVQRDENFWTISRLYYGSGRYYKALWAANSDRVSAPEKLVVGMTIRIPPPEALDRSLVEAPSPSGSVSAQERLPQRPLNQGNDPNNRPRSTSEIELALPVGSPTAASLPSPESDSQTLADSRAVANYPSYQVRPHDTLRSIARDTLGDARRAREIFEMNRDTISDQRQLTPGQHLVLPEDARLGRRSK